MGRISNILHNAYLNPNYDIVWSFKFLLSSTGLTSQNQGGFVTYLATSGTSFSTGGSGQFLGYDDFPTGGIKGATLGVGFDTLGLFGVSGIGSRTSGVGIENAKRNSVTIRGGYSAFTMLYNESLSALNTNFTLLTNTEDYQWLRLRLGNVGQTLYVDYRRNDNDSYTNIIELPVTLSLSAASFYSVGISFAYPLTSTTFSETGSNTVLRIKNFQVEGNTTIPDTYVFSTTSTTITAFEFETNTPPITSNRILALEDEHIFIT